jgi:hypothetical protein
LLEQAPSVASDTAITSGKISLLNRFDWPMRIELTLLIRRGSFAAVPSDSIMIESDVRRSGARGGVRGRLTAMDVPWLRRSLLISK